MASLTLHDNLLGHRTAAEESKARMRATNADIQDIIRRSRKIIDESREAIGRLDALLDAWPGAIISSK